MVKSENCLVLWGGGTPSPMCEVGLETLKGIVSGEYLIQTAPAQPGACEGQVFCA